MTEQKHWLVEIINRHETSEMCGQKWTLTGREGGRGLLNELYFWTLSIVWCLRKLRNKIYIPKNHNTHIQNSHKGQLLTTEPLAWVHTQHKPLKQVRHRWQQMIQPLHTSQLLKPGKHKYRIQTKAHAHPHTPWNTRSQGKPQVAISDTAATILHDVAKSLV
jgi:hypothetical protein